MERFSLYLLVSEKVNFVIYYCYQEPIRDKTGSVSMSKKKLLLLIICLVGLDRNYHIQILVTRQGFNP